MPFSFLATLRHPRLGPVRIPIYTSADSIPLVSQSWN